MNHNEQKIKGLFKLVRASQLSLDDYVVTYIPRTYGEKMFKEELTQVIKAGVHDFWRPVCDPALNADGRICYELGMMPAVGKSPKWWVENASKYAPEKGSRLGTRAEYIAFLAMLIKELVASGWNVNTARSAVCNSSNVLGHYFNFQMDYKGTFPPKPNFEPTGSREICGWYDLANTRKILMDDWENGGFCNAGGSCKMDDKDFPLADIGHYYGPEEEKNFIGTGWIVLNEAP